MKKFGEWLEGRLDEVSADLLRTAADRAQGRGDPRGANMADRLGRAALRRDKGVFRSGRPTSRDNFEITFNYQKENKSAYLDGPSQFFMMPITILVNKIEKGRSGEFVLTGHNEEFGRVFVGIKRSVDRPHRITAASTLGKKHLNDNTPLFLDRKNARILADKLNNHIADGMGEDEVFIPYRPTEFPLAH